MHAATTTLTVDRCIRFHAGNTPGKIAIADEVAQLTFAELDARIDRAAAMFRALGLCKGDRVAILLRNRLEWAELLFACARTGVVAVPVNSRFMDEEVAHVVTHSESCAVITEPALSARIDGLRAKAKTIHPERYLIVGSEPVLGYISYEQLRDAPRAAFTPSAEVLETDCWYLGYTSGTTGRPKAVIINHRGRVLSACFAAIEFGVGESDKTYLVMPLFHSNGIFFMSLLLYVGGTVHVAADFSAEATLSAISDHGITLISLVPTMYAMILALPKATRSGYRLQSLRVTLSSSAPLLAKTKEEMLVFFPGASIYEFYGSTEASFVTCLKPRDQTRKLRSVGQPFFGTEVRVLNDGGREVAPGEAGELWSRSAMQSYEGYYMDPQATQAAYRSGGWFSAGDMATVDDEGYVYIVDRKKDLIITGGENVYPSEVENVLARHPAIAEVAVIGVPDEVWGDRVCAVVRLHDGHTLTVEELRTWSKTLISDFKCPRQLELWTSLPKGPTGKLLRRHIREQLNKTTE